MRLEKQAIVRDIQGQLAESEFVFLADCRGLNVEQFTSLRRSLRDSKSRVTVVRNSAFGKAAEASGWGDVSQFLDGPTAMILGKGDAVETARIVNKFVRQNTLPVLKGGRLGASMLSAKDVEAMADLPSREILLGRAVGTIAAPLSQLVGVMNQKVLTLLYALKAITDKKQG